MQTAQTQSDTSNTQEPDNAQSSPTTAFSSDDSFSSTAQTTPSSKAAKASSLAQDPPAESTYTSFTASAAPPAEPTGAHDSQSQASGSAVTYIPTVPPAPSATVSGNPGSLNLTPAQYATSSRAKVPPAAIALPLALVGATLLLSLFLSLVSFEHLSLHRSAYSHF